MPPVAASVCEYGVLTVPLGRLGALVMSIGEAMASVNDLLAVPEALSLTCTVKLELPELLGVPLMTPDAGLNKRPFGSAPEVTVQVYCGVPPIATSD